jgi:septal ring factor EnvC (AmiA/AmiB activator)
MKHLIKLGTQFIGFRDAAEDLRGKSRFTLSNPFFSASLFCVLTADSRILTFLSEALDKAEQRANALAIKLEQSEKAREKAEQDAAPVEDLRKRLQNAENALRDKISQQIAHENAIIGRLDTQNRRFVSKFLLLSSKLLLVLCIF